MTINDLKIGEEGVIREVLGEGVLRLRFLDMGLIPRTKVRVQKIAPLGDPIQLSIRGYELTIRREDAGKIMIESEASDR
ncbi:MAG TPA: ferrous iron transport protein A [Lachnospiraceae bacterium]|nr:ferrous iron transport protein A [Lachnospiraceae bacterium]